MELHHPAKFNSIKPGSYFVGVPKRVARIEENVAADRVKLRNAYEITSRFDCALGHATCLLGCSENSKGNAAWAITGKT